MKRITLLILIISFTGAIAILYPYFETNSLASQIISNPNYVDFSAKNLEYSIHLPIKIIGNENFTGYNGVIDGEGTREDPYIIEGWNIDAHGGTYGIWIENTTAYFIIRNCKIWNATHVTCCIPEPFGAGIRLVNVKNGKISNNNIVHNIYGILLVSSPKNIILNNTISDNWYGAIIHKSSSTFLNNNSIVGNMRGVYIFQSSNITLLKNNVSSNYDGYGMLIEKSHRLIISQNNISNNLQSGIDMDGVFDSMIINNTIFNDSYGISMADHSFNNTVEYNTVFYNDVDIEVGSFGRNIIAYNSLGENSQGICIDRSQNNIVVHNHVSNSTISSISLWNASYNIVANNTMEKGGISIMGTLQQFLTNRIDKTNNVNGRPIYFLKNASGVNIPTDAGEVILANCRDMTVENLNLNNVSVGITIAYSSRIKISNNTLMGCPNGIYIQNSFNNSILNNKISLSFEGIVIFYSYNNTLRNNSIFKNDMQGIFMYEAYKNIIENNNISNNNWDGIYLWIASNNVIVGNNISENRNYGVYIGKECSHNIVYSNLFFYNHGSGNSFNSSHIQARDDGSQNYWNSTTRGNYWHDWANNNYTNDKNQDGIVDWPYKIDGSSEAMDYHPLKSSASEKVSEESLLYYWWIFVMVSVVIAVGIVVEYQKRRR